VKALRTAFLQVVLATVILAAVPPEVRAFHEGGVGACDGCHSIHNYRGGGDVGVRGAYLLIGQDASSTCLTCHEQSGDPGPTSYHVSTPDVELASPNYPKQLTPGGDFGWLKKTFSWLTGPGQLFTSQGDHHGHNIAAFDYGYMAEQRIAPGGVYPGDSMSCVSCHDPHGRYRRNVDGSITTGGNPIVGSGSYSTSPDPDLARAVGVYRLLGGSGYYPRSVGAGFAFLANPPSAVAPPDYNRAETTGVTRVAYGAGMSDWCRNCHANVHKGTDAFTHPSPIALGAIYTAYYNSYVKYSDISGTEDTAYWSLVPFEVGTDNYTTLKRIVTTTPAKGPDLSDGTPAVMCLSCHRAHASSWDAAMRWNKEADFDVYNGYYSQEGQPYQPYGQGRTEGEALQGYYQIPATRYNASEPSASFCYKCHNPIPTPP
jgi:hypothetical protein